MFLLIGCGNPIHNAKTKACGIHSSAVAELCSWPRLPSLPRGRGLIGIGPEFFSRVRAGGDGSTAQDSSKYVQCFRIAGAISETALRMLTRINALLSRRDSYRDLIFWNNQGEPEARPTTVATIAREIRAIAGIGLTRNRGRLDLTLMRSPARAVFFRALSGT